MTSRRNLLKTALALPALSALATGTIQASAGRSAKIIDHFMWAAIDLESASAEFENLTGVRPVFGGVHHGFGTHNALVSMANGSYMEVLALDSDQNVENPIVNEIKSLGSPEILAFHVQSKDLESIASILESMNIKYTGPLDLSRERPDGEILRWRLLFPESPLFKHALPIFIDWMEAPHPSLSAPAGCELLHLEVGHPNATELRALYQKLNVQVEVIQAEKAYAKAILNSPKGLVTLSGQL